jgi:thioredoxin-related protein
MRKLLFVTLIGFFTLPVLAQQAPRATGSTPVSSGSKTAGSNPSTQRSPAPSSASTQRSPSPSTGKPSVERSKGGNTSSGSTGTAQDRSANPAPSYNATPNYRTTIARPSDVPKNGKTTPRSTSNTPNKKAAPLKPAEIVKINWLTIEEAVEKNKTEKRKIYVDVYTDWCGWCKHMDSTTFVQPAVAKYINEHYYAVKFNAEQEQDVNFNGHVYKFKRTGGRGHHELAAYWLNNKLSFPTSVFLDENLNTIQPLGGFLDGNKLEAILNYFGTNSHRSVPWESYERKFTEARNGN